MKSSERCAPNGIFGNASAAAAAGTEQPALVGDGEANGDRDPIAEAGDADGDEDSAVENGDAVARGGGICKDKGLCESGIIAGNGMEEEAVFIVGQKEGAEEDDDVSNDGKESGVLMAREAGGVGGDVEGISSGRYLRACSKNSCRSWLNRNATTSRTCDNRASAFF